MNRKHLPITRGVLSYFPAALRAIAHVSWVGNEKHNPGQPLHWDRTKSTDHADACARHLVDALEHGPLALGDDGLPHLACAAWRVLAWLQTELEKAK